MALVKDPDNIRLGIIGMTEGNGHPYSWSAIFNGYNPEEAAKTPYPGIANYLSLQPKSAFGIPGARMAAVYCNNRADAEMVSKMSLVPMVVDKPEEMIGHIDAVLVATDIGSEHVERVRPFVEAGIPIFVDKPLCDNLEDLRYFRKLIASGYPLMSSSCMRYAKELVPYHNRNFTEIGDLRVMVLYMIKKWETYGIHALEAMYPLCGPGFVSVRNVGTKERNIVTLHHRDGFDVVIILMKGMVYAPGIEIMGTNASLRLTTHDTFGTFKAQLAAFVNYLKTGCPPFPFSETDELMQLVIAGIISRERGGEVVELPLV